MYIQGDKVNRYSVSKYGKLKVPLHLTRKVMGQGERMYLMPVASSNEGRHFCFFETPSLFSLDVSNVLSQLNRVKEGSTTQPQAAVVPLWSSAPFSAPSFQLLEGPRQHE